MALVNAFGDIALDASVQEVKTAVEGLLTDAQLRASPVVTLIDSVATNQVSSGVSGTDNALTTHSIITGETTAGGGSYVNVKVNPSGALAVSVGDSALPTGAATEATLSSLNTKTPALGQALMAASSPVVIASNQSALPVTQSGTWNVGLSAGTNNIGDVDVLSLPSIPSGSNTIGGVNLAQYTPVSGRMPVDGSGVTQPVSGPLTDAQLRASAVPVSGTVTANTGLTQPLTDTQLRASAVPVSGTVTANTGLTQPLTDAQLRASAVPVSLSSQPLPTGAATEATLAAVNTKLPTAHSAANGMPDYDLAAMPVRQLPQRVIATSYASSGSGVDTTSEVLVATGAGMAVNRTGGNLVITSGTTANSETVIRSAASFDGRFTFSFGDTLSQRIVNNNFYREVVDVIGDGLAYNIINATTVDVTKASHGFTAENVGQRIDICAITGAAGIPMEGVIASIPDANTIRFTVAGWPASGTGTCSLTGWNKIELNWTGTTATVGVLNTRRRGYQNTATNLTSLTTASGTHTALTLQNDRVSISNGNLAIGGVLTDRSVVFTNIPEPDTQFYYQIRVKNGTTAPASTTTWTCAFTRVQDFIATQVELTGLRALGAGVAVPITGPVTVSSGTVAVSTVTTVSAVTAANLAIPGIIADVASAALTTTTTTATLTPTFGTTYTVNIPVTAVSGTNPTLDVRIEESDDTATNWFPVYDFPRITTTGIYRTPPLTLRANRLRYVQTVGGTTPSFTRAINRLQRSDDAPLRVQFIDRTIVPNTLNSTTPTYYIEGCKDFNFKMRVTAQTTPATVAFQGSDNGADWESLTPTITTAVGVVSARITNVQYKFGRLIITAAGTGITLGEAMIVGAGS